MVRRLRSRTSPMKKRMQSCGKSCCISNCLSSSREYMMTFLGAYRLSRVLTNCLPKDPVPPVIRMLESLNISAVATLMGHANGPKLTRARVAVQRRLVFLTGFLSAISSAGTRAGPPTGMLGQGLSSPEIVTREQRPKELTPSVPRALQERRLLAAWVWTFGQVPPLCP